MNGYLLNLDDDRHGRSPATMRHLYGINDGQVPWCLVCGDWHPAGAMHTSDVMLVGELMRIAEALERATAPVVTCQGCGCLVRDLEVCPGCLVASLHHPSCPTRLDAGATCLGCDPLTSTLPRRRDDKGSAALSALLVLVCWVAVVGFAIMLMAGWLDWWPDHHGR